MKLNKELNEIAKKQLASVLAERMDKNPLYSLRSFAGNIGIDASSLSKFLRGKRSFETNKIKKLLVKSGISENEFEKLKLKTDEEPFLLDIAQAKILSTWYHISILELTHLAHFDPSPKWIANQLRLNEAQVGPAVQRLLKSGALSINEQGVWFDNWENTTAISNPDMDESCFREYQKQIRLRAIDSIEKDPGNKKDHTAYELAMDSALFPEIKEDIKNFRRTIAKKIRDHSTTKDCVVNLSISLFCQNDISEHETNKRKS
ncbi:MAG: TIGR02147 family protein [Bdellovibrionales bacterium]